nr:MAG TPA: hypothetical protein [Herelleviridae sp. ctsMP6]
MIINLFLLVEGFLLGEKSVNTFCNKVMFNVGHFKEI